VTQAETCSPHFGRDATATTYRDIHLPRVFAPWARILLEIVTPQPGEAVLDVATGPGTVARQAAVFAGPQGRVIGVDISAAMLNVARSFPPEPGAAPIEYVESSATRIPLPDGSFEVAYCQQGLQHMADPMAALGEIRRTLKPGGRVAVAIWAQSPFGLFREVVANMHLQVDAPQPSTFGREPADLVAALGQAGFAEVAVQRREMVSVLEGGVPQALEVAVATSAAAAMSSLPAETQQAIREAISKALQPFVKADGVHLPSVANIASARVPRSKGPVPA
jgi:ubiquinone/menaquinone biosynthesis C-methylase UbiE